MNLSVGQFGEIQLRKVFNPIVLISTSGETMQICMRDGGFEFNYNDKMYSVKNGVIESFELLKSKISTISKEQLETVNK